MAKLAALIVFCCCCFEASAHVLKSDIHLARAKPGLRSSLRLGEQADSHAKGALTQFHSHTDIFATGLNTPSQLKTSCYVMLGLLVFWCCCSGFLKYIVGETPAAVISLTLPCCMLAYLIMSGVYDAWWSGKPVGMACRIMCWWLIFQIVVWMILLVCVCCGGMALLIGAVVVKNESIKKMKADFEEKEHQLSAPRREYYKSDVFKDKCDALFDKADLDGNGTLNMSELQYIVGDMLGEDFKAHMAQKEMVVPDEAEKEKMQLMFMVAMLREAFDENGDSVVEKAEFLEMAKYLSVMRLQDGKFDLEQAFEILLLPETATMADVNKSYRKLAMKYHPDKRPGEDPDVVAKDMAEINDAKALLEKHFQEQEKK